MWWSRYRHGKPKDSKKHYYSNKTLWFPWNRRNLGTRQQCTAVLASLFCFKTVLYKPQRSDDPLSQGVISRLLPGFCSSSPVTVVYTHTRCSGYTAAWESQRAANATGSAYRFHRIGGNGYLPAFVSFPHRAKHLSRSEAPTALFLLSFLGLQLMTTKPTMLLIFSPYLVWRPFIRLMLCGWLGSLSFLPAGFRVVLFSSLDYRLAVRLTRTDFFFFIEKMRFQGFPAYTLIAVWKTN